MPSKIKFYTVNVSNKDELEETFKMFLDDYSGIDILINNAAITVPATSEDYPSDDWYRTLDTFLYKLRDGPTEKIFWLLSKR